MNDKLKISFLIDSAEKSILGSDQIENMLTNIHIAAYNSSTGLLEAFYFGQCSQASLNLSANVKYDIYAVSNLPENDSIVFPMEEVEVKNMKYVIPSYSSLKQFGLPACYFKHNVSFSSPSEVAINLTRLFARITLRINHEGLTGGNDGLFSNMYLYLRQANSCLYPFKEEGGAALFDEDIMELSDYDPDMTLSSSGDEFVFYVPENVQGVLLPGNTDQKYKTMESLQEICPQKIPLLTYIEYTGELQDGARGSGIEGNITYRFYIGNDAVSDFSIERNKDYRIDLSFSADGLWEGTWKVSSNIEDNRSILLSKDGVYLKRENTLVVRPNHPAVFTLNVSNGSGNLCRAGLLDEMQPVPDLSKPYWCSNLIGRTKAALQDLLDENGLAAKYDEATGVITIEVVNEQLFKPDVKFKVVFTLSPDNQNPASLNIRTMDKLDCVFDAPIQEFYLAQKRSFYVKNAFSRYFPEISGSFVEMTNLKEDNSFELNAVNTSSSPSQQWTKLRLVPEDPKNDDILEYDFRIKLPYPQFDGKTVKNLELLMDGSSSPTNFEYYAEDKKTILPYSSFDKNMLSRLMAFEMEYQPMYSWCNSPEFIDYKFYPNGEMHLVKFYVPPFDFRDYIAGKIDYPLAIFSYRPKRDDLYDETEYPSLYVTVKNPFPYPNELSHNLGAIHISAVEMPTDFSIPFYPVADVSQLSAKWNNEKYFGNMNPILSVEEGKIRVSCSLEDLSNFNADNDKKRVLTITLQNKFSLETFEWDYTINFY